ncbi:MAG: dethiobiotin synthase [Planctomycetaceae bacterium]|nr:dethiobiotin synthase [Planctomycetaceae bacterium]
MKTVFMTGTDTGVGKTHVTCALIRNLRKLGLRVGAYKPVCSGAEQDASGKEVWHDLQRLQEACANQPAVFNGTPPVDVICPQRFRAPVAPHVAARAEGRTVQQNLLHEGLQQWKDQADIVVIEGAGGLLCPLTDHLTVADLICQLQTTVTVVSPNRLGTINHTLLTVEAIRARNIPMSAVVLNEPAAPDNSLDDSAIDHSRSSNLPQLTHWLDGIPLFHSPFTHDPASATIDPVSEQAREAESLERLVFRPPVRLVQSPQTCQPV